jgi:hypothetical protein
MFVLTRIEGTVAKIASLTRKMAGIVWAVVWRPFHPVLSFETAEDEK